jgi:hypothetical protein
MNHIIDFKEFSTNESWVGDKISLLLDKASKALNDRRSSKIKKWIDSNTPEQNERLYKRIKEELDRIKKPSGWFDLKKSDNDHLTAILYGAFGAHEYINYGDTFWFYILILGCLIRYKKSLRGRGTFEEDQKRELLSYIENLEKSIESEDTI